MVIFKLSIARIKRLVLGKHNSFVLNGIFTSSIQPLVYNFIYLIFSNLSYDEGKPIEKMPLIITVIQKIT